MVLHNLSGSGERYHYFCVEKTRTHKVITVCFVFANILETRRGTNKGAYVWLMNFKQRLVDYFILHRQPAPLKFPASTMVQSGILAPARLSHSTPHRPRPGRRLKPSFPLPWILAFSAPGSWSLLRALPRGIRSDVSVPKILGLGDELILFSLYFIASKHPEKLIS